MIKLVLLLLLLSISDWARAQTELKYELQQKKELISEKKSVEESKSEPSSETGKDKSAISSAARRSSLTSHTTAQGTDTSPNYGKQAGNVKSLSQARRPSTEGRPAQVNIPVIPVPGIAKPNRMTIPNRRLSLPVGKS